MSNRLLKNIICSNSTKNGANVTVKILIGPLTGQEFKAKKVQESIDGQITFCYHIHEKNLSTYFHEKDIIEI
jgi:hypothetical protein